MKTETYPKELPNKFIVRKVENGFILTVSGPEYFETPEFVFLDRETLGRWIGGATVYAKKQTKCVS